MMQIRQNAFYALPIGVAYSGSYTLATTGLEYGALFNDYGEYTDNFTVNISSIFFVRI